MSSSIEWPRTLRGLPEPWNKIYPLGRARESLAPTEANVRAALDVATRALEESLRIPPSGDYSGFPAYYADDESTPWFRINLALSAIDEFDMSLVHKLYEQDGFTIRQAEIVATDWVSTHIREIAAHSLIWIAEARDNQPNAAELPEVYALCDRFLERVTPDLGVELLSTIWDIAREGAHPRLLAAAANPNLSDRVRQKAEFLFGLSLEDPNELKELILSGEPALPQDREPRE